VIGNLERNAKGLVASENMGLETGRLERGAEVLEGVKYRRIGNY
jgi:hypothetical protein